MTIIKGYEFTNVQFKKVFFSNNNIYGKILFTLDSNNKFRVHIIKELDQENQEVEDTSYIKQFPDDFLVTKIMPLRYDPSVYNIENEILDADHSLQNFGVKRVECFADFIIVVYEDKIFFDIFKKNGKLFERKYVKGDF